MATTDGENLRHLSDCPGCSQCQALLEWYASCDKCGAWCHKSTMMAVYAVATESMQALCEICKPKEPTE